MSTELLGDHYTITAAMIPRVSYHRNRVKSITPRFMNIQKSGECFKYLPKENPKLTAIQQAENDVTHNPSIVFLHHLGNDIDQSATSSVKPVLGKAKTQIRNIDELESLLVSRFLICVVPIKQSEDSEETIIETKRLLEALNQIKTSRLCLIFRINPNDNSRQVSDLKERLESLSRQMNIKAITPLIHSDSVRNDAEEQMVNCNSIMQEETTLLRTVSDILETELLTIIELIEHYIRAVIQCEDVGIPSRTVKVFEKMLFEIDGIYRMSIWKDMKASSFKSTPPLSKELSLNLLRIPHVFGCGKVYGKLTIHIKDTQCPEDERIARQSISDVIREQKYPYEFDIDVITGVKLLSKECPSGEIPCSA